MLFGDIHVYEKVIAPWRMLNRRFIGQLSYYFKRKRRFNLALLRQACDQALKLEPSYCLLSGDLSGTGLKSEVSAAIGALKVFHEHQVPILGVPGNHDRYTMGSVVFRRFEKLISPQEKVEYPYIKQLNACWWLVGLNAATPRIITSRGKVSDQQIAAAQGLMKDLPAHAGIVILCHYPFIVPEDVKWSWHHRLANARAVRRMVAELHPRPVIYMHGHIHKPWHWRPKETELSHVQMVNAGSPTQTTHTLPRGQGFWQIDLPQDTSACVELVHHDLA